MKLKTVSNMSRLATLALASASFLAVASAQAKEITIWCWDPNFNGATMKEAGERYAKLHPDVTLNIVDFAKADVEQKLQTTLSSGATDSLPDIVLIEDYGAQKYLQSFPGAFAPISDSIDLKGFAPYKVQLATYEGKAYSMPFDSGVTGMYYRKDYLAEAGFKPEDMQNITWDRYIEIGKAVEAKTGKKMLGIDPNEAGMIRIMMQSGGQWYFNADGSPNIEGNAALKAALETDQKIVQSGIQKPTSGWNEWVAAFTSGDVASVITGVWITGTIKSQPEQADKWGVAPIPKLSIDGAINASNLGGSSWYVLESSAEKAEAIDFLNETFGKDVDFYQKILVDRGAVGSLDGPAYKAPDAFFGGETVWQSFSDWLAQVPSVSYGTFTNEVDSAVISQLPGLAAGGSVDEAIKAIDAQVKTQLQ
jgi:lactose/L-arabinose transport system substrate-binding protein